MKASDALETVAIPTIETVAFSSSRRQTLAVTTVSSSIFGSELLSESQLIILVDFRRFQQPSDLRGSLALSLLGGLLSGFSIFGVEVGVVSREFLELDEEVSDVELEAAEVTAECEEAFDEIRYLCTRQYEHMVSNSIMTGRAHG
jgi:hypothetical protein